MKNFTGQKFGLILKDWTSVIKLKNSNGNAPITLFTPHLDIEINVFNRSSCLPPILNPNIILFSFKLTVPTFKVFIKIVMFDMNR
jgi:hypothetical protein